MFGNPSLGRSPQGGRSNVGPETAQPKRSSLHGDEREEAEFWGPSRSGTHPRTGFLTQSRAGSTSIHPNSSLAAHCRPTLSNDPRLGLAAGRARLLHRPSTGGARNRAPRHIQAMLRHASLVGQFEAGVVVSPCSFGGEFRAFFQTGHVSGNCGRLSRSVRREHGFAHTRRRRPQLGVAAEVTHRSDHPLLRGLELIRRVWRIRRPGGPGAVSRTRPRRTMSVRPFSIQVIVWTGQFVANRPPVWRAESEEAVALQGLTPRRKGCMVSGRTLVTKVCSISWFPSAGAHEGCRRRRT